MSLSTLIEVDVRIILISLCFLFWMNKNFIKPNTTTTLQKNWNNPPKRACNKEKSNKKQQPLHTTIYCSNNAETKQQNTKQPLQDKFCRFQICIRRLFSAVLRYFPFPISLDLTSHLILAMRGSSEISLLP